MGKQSLDAFRRTVTVSWPKHQDASAKALLIKTAQAGNEVTVREQTSRAGVPPKVTSYANQPGRPVDQVELPGPIVYRYEYLAEVATVALDELRKASPVVSGRYRDNHTLFINGTALKAVPKELPEGADIFISNPLPYVRKLEIGKTRSGRDFVIQVPDRIYERTAALLHQRYHNAANVGFGFVRITSGAIVDWAQTGRARRLAQTRRGGNAALHTDWLTRQPAIFIGPL